MATHPLHDGTFSEDQISLLNEMRNQCWLCDAVLLTEDGDEFPVHRAYMCGFSPYFFALFNTPLHPTPRSRVILPGVSKSNLHHIVEYVYTGWTDITVDNASDLMADADYLDVFGLVRECHEFIVDRLDVDNCVGVHQFAKNFLLRDLETVSHRFVLRHFARVATDSDEVLELPVAELATLLSSNGLNVRHESVVWEAVLRWIRKDTADRLHHLELLMNHVRLLLLGEKYFNDWVKKHPFVILNDQCRTMVREAEKMLRPNRNSRSRVPPEGGTYVWAKTRLPRDILFTVGGWHAGSPTNSMESYDIRANRWKEIAEVDPMGPRAYHGVCSIDYVIYIVGGYDGTVHFNSCRSFNVMTKQWKELAPMNYRRCYVSTVVLDGLIYAMGGYDGAHRQNTVERYDYSANQWSLIASMHERRSDASATTLNDKIYIVGGFNGRVCVNTCERYDAETDQWSRIATMQISRSGVACIDFNNKIYALGGYDGARRQRSCEVFDPDRNTWTPMPNMMIPRSNFAVEVVDDKLYAVGGFDGSTTVNNVEYFDFQSCRWFRAATLNQNRSALGSCVVVEMPNLMDYIHHDRSLQLRNNEVCQRGVKG